MPQLIPAIVSYGVQAATLSTLGAIGSGIAGAIAGGLIASALAPTQKSEGPRLGDLRVQSSSYGTVIPYVLGEPRIAGQIIWASTRREISTVTESGGKGGGGQENTTYTYEVDLLILLTDNEQEGINKVWLNGGLVWNKSSTADNATIAASDDLPHWTSITVYNGAASQMPDPIYENAVGSANAPAYRGKLTVMIQSLQLGSNGQLPNLTFQIGPVTPIGDHPAADGLTRLQTAFAGGSTADISSYAMGSGTIVQNASNGGLVTTTDGELVATHVAPFGGGCYIYWVGNGLGRKPFTGWTFEFFMSAEEVSVDPSSMAVGVGNYYGFAVSEATEAPLKKIGLGMQGSSFGSPNYTQVISASRISYQSPTDVFAEFAGMTHVAFVSDASSSGDMRIYIDGTLRATYTPGTSQSTASPYVGYVQVGINWASNEDMIARFSGVRVRDAEMYTGGTYSAPTSPADWGPP